MEGRRRVGRVESTAFKSDSSRLKKSSSTRETLDEGEKVSSSELLFKPVVYLEDDIPAGRYPLGGTVFLISAAIHNAIVCQEALEIGGMDGVLVAAHAGSLGVANGCRLIPTSETLILQVLNEVANQTASRNAGMLHLSCQAVRTRMGI